MAVSASSSDEVAAASTATTITSDPAPLFAMLDATADALRRAPPSEKFEFSKEVAGAVRALGAAGALPTWGAARKDAALLTRRTIGLGDLRMIGITAPEQIAIPGVRNDLTFLTTVVGVSSVAAVLVGQLPGDWGGLWRVPGRRDPDRRAGDRVYCSWSAFIFHGEEDDERERERERG